jgi:DNA repair exonuclease SbcCD ATPase subunit
MFTQVNLCRTSKMAEIAEAERALEASVNVCQGQLDAQRYTPAAQPRNRLEYIVAQGAALNLADVRKELTFFAASSYELGQITRMLDTIRISVVPGVNARATGQVSKAPVLPTAAGPQGGEMEDLQRRVTELTMETTAKDQALATMKNNRDELKSQFAARRADYEATIKELRNAAGGSAGVPTHLQDTIQDLKDEKKRLQETVKQYEDALNTLKSQFSQKLSQLQEAKDKVEKDAVAMALLLRSKLPEMERAIKERTMERDSLTDLRNRLDGLFSSVPMINVGCNEGRMVLQARRLIEAQKNGGTELPDIIRIVMMGGI